MPDGTKIKTTWPADSMHQPGLPLSDLKVADFTQTMAGSACAEMLGDMGADVIKIEALGQSPEERGGPPVIEGQSGGFMVANRNKRSLALDWQDQEDRAAAFDLACRADILIEDWLPGQMDQVGLSYPAISAVNPGIVYASVPGFGRGSPWAGIPSSETLAQAMSGLMLSIGEEGGPPVRAGAAVASIGAAIFCACGILCACIHCRATGRGQLVETSLLDVATILQVKQALQLFVNGKLPPRMGSGDMNPGPYRAFKTKDGGITLGGANANNWPKMCAVLGVPELIDDPRFATPAQRTANGAELTEIFKPILLRRTTDEWLAELRERGVPCGPVYNLAQTVADPQVGSREMIIELDILGSSFRTVGIPVKLSRTPGVVRRRPPTLGEHTEEILSEMGTERASRKP